MAPLQALQSITREQAQHQQRLPNAQFIASHTYLPITEQDLHFSFVKLICPVTWTNIYVFPKTDVNILKLALTLTICWLTQASISHIYYLQIMHYVLTFVYTFSLNSHLPAALFLTILFLTRDELETFRDLVLNVLSNKASIKRRKDLSLQRE